jgi:hypothetical protein
MDKIIKVQIPDNWSDITLEKYLTLSKDLEAHNDDPDAQMAFLIYHLCGINAEDIQLLSLESYNHLKVTLLTFMNNQECELQRIIKVDGVEYGFEPNLSAMSYGTYVDITRYDTLTIDKNWGKIMSILYRPVIDKRKDMYTIKDYDGKIDDTKFMNVGMDIHFGALFFFVNLLKDLSHSTLNYLIQKPGLHPRLKQILEKSGAVTQQLSNLLEETSKK